MTKQPWPERLWRALRDVTLGDYLQTEVRNTEASPLFVQTAYNALTFEVDKFGRARVSSPRGLFDAHMSYDLVPRKLRTGSANSGTVVHNANERVADLTVATTQNSHAVIQSRYYHHYQPGKSQLIFMTFCGAGVELGATARVGYYDASNGVGLRIVGKAIPSFSFFERSKVSGTVVDTAIAQEDWNLDPMDGTGPSGVVLDTNVSQILWVAFEALYVGDITFGFVVGGKPHACHTIYHANNGLTSTYAQTMSLPVRWELIQNANPAEQSSSLKAICSSVISEGGQDHLDVPYSMPVVATRTNLSNGVEVPLMAVRLKSNFNSLGPAQQVARRFLPRVVATEGVSTVRVYLETVLTGAGWVSASADSVLEYDVSATAFSGGYLLTSFPVVSGGTNPSKAQPDTAEATLGDLALGFDTDETVADILVVTIEPEISTPDVYGYMDWFESK